MKLKNPLSILLTLALLAGLLPAAALAVVPNDPDVDRQWGLEAIRAYEAWDRMPADAQSVTVAVLDNGFSMDHEDLADNLYRDAQGNVVQYDAIDGDFTVAPCDHGMHVAGIISAVANNGVGVAGVSYNYAKILPVQTLSSLDGRGAHSTITDGIRFVIRYKQQHPEANIRVMNLSLSAPAENSRWKNDDILADALNDAWEAGILSVISAGNDAASYDGAAYWAVPIDWTDHAIGVIALGRGAQGEDPVKADWSNYNMADQRTKDLSAPGLDILSTIWDSNHGGKTYGQNRYDFLSGTSQAAPCVAGVAALMFAANPSLTCAEAAELLCATARPIRAGEASYVDGFSREYGWGMVDAAAAVEAALAGVLRGRAALLRGNTIDLTPIAGGAAQEASGWSWSSSDASVAAVENGTVTGVGGGEAVITATRGGATLTKRVTVYDAAFSGPDTATVCKPLELTFTSNPVRDAWRLTVDDGRPNSYERSLLGAPGRSDTLTLLPYDAERYTVTATLATDENVKVTHTFTAQPVEIAEGAAIRVENQIWTGQPLQPEPEVSYRCVFSEGVFGSEENSWSLEKDVDYTLTYENNVEPGTATVTLTGRDWLTGTVSAQFDIVTDYIVEDDVQFDIPAGGYVYDGTEHTPGVRVTHGGAALAEGTDYRVDYAYHVDADTALVTVQGIGGYAGAVSRTFPIAPMDLNADGITHDNIPSYPYCQGELICPPVTVRDERGAEPVELQQEWDYTVSYTNNADVGTATATVTGRGNYTGSFTLSFRICDKVITEYDVTVEQPEGGLVYTGSPLTPRPIVTYNGTELTEGVDYELDSDYYGNINAGNGYVWIRSLGEYTGYYYPRYYGYGIVPVSFRILPADVGSTQITAIPTQDYTGAAVEPDVAATYNGMTLEKDVDYELSYENNIYPGTATVTVTGLGNYAGERTLTFPIVAEPELFDPDVYVSAQNATLIVPVSGEDESVNVKVEVKDDTATVKEADIDKVLEAEEVGTVTIDMSGLEANITEVVIPGAMLTKIADAVADEENSADGLEIKLPTGSVTLDADAVATITEQADGKDLTLHLDDVKITELTSAQQEAVADLEIEVVLDAYLTSNGKRISDFNGGSATVKIPYTLKDGQTAQGLVVWYVAADGTRSQVPARYDGKNVVFAVPHFSNYVIAYDAEKAATCPKDDTCPISAFTDADPTAWYHDGVHFVLANGLMNGTGNGKFAPNSHTSRAMIVTILYRLEGEPDVSGMENPFEDVADGTWYTDAVIWAAEKRIVEGYGDGRFDPTCDITREQLVTIMHRYAKYKGVAESPDANIMDYDDVFEVSAWAVEAFRWSVQEKLVEGVGDNKLAPKGDASRAMIATVVMRYLERFAA